MLGLSLLVAALMATGIARPIRRAAKGATAIGNLDFEQVAPLWGSYFREINTLARSFNAMLEGLRAFERYVPRTLVMRLVKEGRVGSGSEERVLAIMFTDIASFTSMCETMSAGEVAAFINQHLSLVSTCVEQAGGTIDKFIGDAVMAFWGAPGRVENPAASACRAAVAIQQTLAADNKRRAAEGLAPVHIRIGIHMGQVVVGDIGTPNRINYTIVGDAVNAAQRLEVSAGRSTRMPKRSPWSAAKSSRRCRRAFSLSSGARTSSKASKNVSTCISWSAGKAGNGRPVRRLSHPPASAGAGPRCWVAACPSAAGRESLDG